LISDLLNCHWVHAEGDGHNSHFKIDVQYTPSVVQILEKSFQKTLRDNAYRIRSVNKKKIQNKIESEFDNLVVNFFVDLEENKELDHQSYPEPPKTLN